MSSVSRPKVSVHIIAYNQKDYIREAIDGALTQDYPNLEVVVADDGSTDGTAEIIAEYQRAHPGKVIAVLGEENVGITRNSNRGLAACSGELIAFMDSDDTMLPGKVSAQVEWFSKGEDRALCGHQLEVFYEDGSPSHPFSSKLIEGRGAEPLIRAIPFGKSSIMVRARRIPAHRFDEALPIVSDLLMWVEVVGDDGVFGYVPGVLGRYRRHASNVTNDPFHNLDQVGRYLELVGQRFPQYGRTVDFARTCRLFYDPAVALLKMGHKKEARAKLLDAIGRKPWFPRAWVRLVQSCL